MLLLDGSPPAPTPTPAAAPTLVGYGTTAAAKARVPFDDYLGDFSSSDPSETNPGDFVVTVDWGDGAPASAAVVSYNAKTRNFDVGGSHAFAAKGTYHVELRIVGPGGASKAVSSTVRVT